MNDSVPLEQQLLFSGHPPVVAGAVTLGVVASVGIYYTMLGADGEAQSKHRGARISTIASILLGPSVITSCALAWIYAAQAAGEEPLAFDSLGGLHGGTSLLRAFEMLLIFTSLSIFFSQSTVAYIFRNASGGRKSVWSTGLSVLNYLTLGYNILFNALSIMIWPQITLAKHTKALTIGLLLPMIFDLAAALAFSRRVGQKEVSPRDPLCYISFAFYSGSLLLQSTPLFGDVMGLWKNEGWAYWTVHLCIFEFIGHACPAFAFLLLHAELQM